MSWSTREVAELADVTPRAVRHYHQVGLLPEPDRRVNGYKQYGVAHLERLLRITLLTDLGFSLPQIAAMGEAQEPVARAVSDLDAELAATIERLQGARTRLAMIAAPPTDPDELPVELAVTSAAAAAGLTDADRSFMLVLTRVLGPEALAGYAASLQAYRDDPATHEFDALPPDADDATREDLGERLARHTRMLWDRYPALKGWAPARGTRVATNAITTALDELYNPAQVDVLRRAGDALGGEVTSSTGPSSEPAAPQAPAVSSARGPLWSPSRRP